MINLEFQNNIFTEKDLTSMFAKLSGKWVVHLKCIGILDEPTRSDDMFDWYADKTPVEVLNVLINSAPDSREAYVLLDNLEQVTEAYEHWFPIQEELLEDENYLYVKFFAVSPDFNYVFTNEKKKGTN